MRLIIHTNERRIEIPQQCSIAEFINEINDLGLDFDEWEIGERTQTKLEKAVEDYKNITNSTANIEDNSDLCTK